MTNIQSKREREEANSAYLKMRSDYRATLTEKPIEFDNADFVDPGTNKILNGPKLVANQKLTVKIPRWTGIPAETYSDTVTLQLDTGDGRGFVDVAAHEFTRNTGEADFREPFPYAMEITGAFLPRDATCQLKYQIYYYNDEEDESPPVSFLCDQVKPYDSKPPEALTLDTSFLDDTPYEASRSYTYTLTNAVGQQASQTACDVKSVTTTTWVDGLNRAIKEARHDADALGFNRADPPRPTYEAMFDNRGKLVNETLIDWEGAKNVPLESRFQYDNWGAQRCVIRPDGVEEHEHTDPVRLTTTQWLEVAGKDVTGKTVTTNNLFEKPVSVKRYLSGVDPAAPGAQPYSEEVKEYDGIGRAAEELDAARNKTTYTYDVFDRMVKTVLPDFTEVTREYAPHSSEDLPVTISVNEAVLGTQEFNGLDLMVKSTTGGRITEYFFDKGQTQPKSVLRPSGVETKYIYRPELGEDPERRIAHEGTARYVYDEHNARLLMTEEVDENDVTHVLERRYYSTGELKSELRSKTGDEQPYEMHYEYSRQSRLLKYRDVLGQTQTYTLVKGSASSSILRAVGSVLAEQLDGAGPKS